MEKFDICVIGCGPGGFAAASRALDFGKHVCIVESNHVGGAGIMNGAMTSKTMWELSKDYYVAATTNRGYRASGLTVDYTQIRNTIIAAAKEKQYQMLSQIETFSREKNQDGSLTLLLGKGKFKTNKVLEVAGEHETRKIEADYFIIATGSRPRPFPGIPFDQKRIISSDHLLGLKEFPRRLMIIGAGIIGCEFATMFSNFGQTEVHLLDRQSRIIPFEDVDLSDLISKNLQDNQVTIYHNAILQKINKTKDHLEIVIDYEDGHTKVVEADICFISVGRTPNTQDLGLENVNIPTTPTGHLQVDPNMCVKENIYAIGDVTGNSALVNIAEMEGRFAVKAICGKVKFPLKYNNMSTIMFFKPEVACVGLNEIQCREQKIPHRVAYYSLKMSNRAIAMRATHGFVKIMVTKEKDPKILGLRAAGPRASDLIVSIAIAMDHDRNLNDVMRTTQPHPAISEALQSCLRMLVGKSIYKAKAFPEDMKVTEWDPS